MRLPSLPDLSYPISELTLNLPELPRDGISPRLPETSKGHTHVVGR
jgi:hypothetical protein